MLAAIALAPLVGPAWWQHHYPKVAFGLGAITLVYYVAGLQAHAKVGHTAMEYLSFLALMLLLNTGEKLFRDLVPWLILMASGLLAVADPVRNWLQRRAAKNGGAKDMTLGAILPVGLAAVYGGYFGADFSVIVLAVLGLTINDSLTRLNALKQAIAFSVNVAAAVFFVFRGDVVWSAALVMAVFALIGGNLGGRLAGRIKPSTLRKLVVVIGVIVSIIYFVK